MAAYKNMLNIKNQLIFSQIKEKDHNNPKDQFNASFVLFYSCLFTKVILIVQNFYSKVLEKLGRALMRS